MSTMQTYLRDNTIYGTAESTECDSSRRESGQFPPMRKKRTGRGKLFRRADNQVTAYSSGSCVR